MKTNLNHKLKGTLKILNLLLNLNQVSHNQQYKAKVPQMAAAVVVEGLAVTLKLN